MSTNHVLRVFPSKLADTRLVRQLCNVKLRLLNDLHLANHAVLQRKGSSALLLDRLADDLWDELLDLGQLSKQQTRNRSTSGLNNRI